MANSTDLAGQAFGRWKVILSDSGRNRHGQKLARCRCECGAERDLVIACLRDGTSKSCGCVPANIKITPGDRFGKLAVLAQAESDRRGQARWYCRCDCGGNTTVGSQNLTSGGTSTCGCCAGVGEVHHSAKLDAKTVIQARDLASKGYTLGEVMDHLALNGRIHKSAVSLAINKKTWKHLPQ